MKPSRNGLLESFGPQLVCPIPVGNSYLIAVRGGAPRPAVPVRPSLNSESGAKENRFHATYACNRLGESIADTLHKGDHVLIDGQLVSSKYEARERRGQQGQGPSSGACTRIPCAGSAVRRPPAQAGGLFVCPEFLPDKTNLTLRNRNCARYAFSAFPLGLR